MACAYAVRLFVRVRRIPHETVHRRCLGGTQVDVVLSGILQSDKECFGAAQGVGTKLGTVLELELVGELADEWTVLSPGAPDGHVGLAGQAIAEVEQANNLEDFFDNGVADQMDCLLYTS